MSEIPTEPAPFEQPIVARLGKIVLILLCVGALAVGGWYGVKEARLRLALSRAHREFDAGQFMRSEFWSGRALKVDGDNAEATRIIAQIYEVQDMRVAVEWRMRASQRAPGNTADVLAWAKCAFHFKDINLTLKALNKLPSDFKETSADAHELMGGCALARGQKAVAAAEFAKAAELDPKNPLHQVNLAAIQLTESTNPNDREAAARKLESLVADPAVNLAALRALLNDAIRSQDAERAARFVAKVRAHAGHTFDDELNCLEAEMRTPAFQTSLQAAERAAATEGLKAMTLTDWLTDRGMAGETLHWSATLPVATQTNTRVQMSVAEAYAALYDWEGLKRFLEHCQWKDGDYLKMALEVRAKRAQSEPWEDEWKQLLAEVAQHPPQPFLLGELAISWNWRKEALELLWVAAADAKTQAQALTDLWELYAKSRETRELLRVAKAQSEMDPLNPAYKNSEAFLSLLLYGYTGRAERLAHEATVEKPAVPEWATTYAFALNLAGKRAEAKEVIDSIPAEEEGRPGVALYCALVLAANGEADRAWACLDKTDPAGLLPEERKLAEKLAQQLKGGK